ncbi:hypothetical protein DUI87_15966 [Hirundo rustica rustica]|uniref:Uncharacterized protein n=1 Tax=Hirundo rustica rustica TaxID=333673 RepID=A0A3M0JZV4_HIRRU|nr:hypothetical protein DUI87_15966 [Hirundo rustica rustica]
MEEVSEDWKKANVTPFSKKAKKYNPGNSRSVSFISIPGMVMEQLILGEISKPVEEKKVIWNCVGEEEAKKPYKYDCLYSENEKPVSEIELKLYVETSDMDPRFMESEKIENAVILNSEIPNFRTLTFF